MDLWGFLFRITCKLRMDVVYSGLDRSLGEGGDFLFKKFLKEEFNLLFYNLRY